MLDRSVQDTYNRVDKWGMMTPQGKQGDSILLTFEAWFAYRDEKFVSSILDCFNFTGKKVLGFRHPSENKSDGMSNISRDHYIAALLTLYLFQRDSETARQRDSDKYKMLLRMMVFYIRTALAPGHRITLDLHLWARSLISRKYWSWYAIAIPFLFISMLWNKMLQFIGGFYEIENEQYRWSEPSRIQRFVRKIRFPSYAHYLASWQNHVMPDSWMKSLLCLVLRIDTGRFNPVTRLLNGRSAISYIPMSAGRLNTRTDHTNDRAHLCPLDHYEARYNAVDEDLAEKLIEIRQHTIKK